MYLMDGQIELSHVEDGKDIAVDSLDPGSHLFSYTFLTKKPIQITGVAKGRVSVLVLPMQSLQFSRRINSKFREEISKVESYIEENGVPKLDYTRFRPYRANPKRRLSEAVGRLISIQKLEKKKKLNFTDLVNVLK